MKRNWIFVLLVFAGACNSPEGGVERDSLSEATQDTAVVYPDEKGNIAADGAEVKEVGDDAFASVNWDAPVAEDADLKGTEIEKRANKEQTLYTIDDRIMFDTDKAQIRPQGEEKLQQIVKDLKELPEGSPIRVYGHADARASNEYNKDLSAERAQAVRDWLQQKGGIKAERLSTEAFGETEPRATNETARGRQLNRRVAIVVTTRP